MNYKFFIGLVLVIFSLTPCYAIKSNHGLDGFVQNKIDPVKNARLHSNMGNIYFDEGKYFAALKEYEIAYNLAYNTQAGGVYLYNIAQCHISLGDYNTAKKVLDGAIKKDCMNITYYKTLAQCLFNLGIAKSELDKYLVDTKNPYNKIMVGLLYMQLGQNINAKSIFDEFVAQNPKMIITEDVKVILRQL